MPRTTLAGPTAQPAAQPGDHLGRRWAPQTRRLYDAGVAAAELIQDLETTVGAFFLTYFSAGLFALWIPVVYCRAICTRCCNIRSRQRYELLPQGEDGVNTADEEGEREGISGNEEDADDSGFMQAGRLASATSPACGHMLRLGLLFGPLWFFANWTYNASLGLTSVRRCWPFGFSPSCSAEAAACTYLKCR